MVIISMRMNEIKIIHGKTNEKLRGLKCNLKKTLTFKGQAMEMSMLELPVSI